MLAQLELGLPIPTLLQPGGLEAFGLYLIRTGALVMSTPLLGSRVGFSGFKVAILISFSVVMFLATGGLGRADELASLPAAAYGMLAMRELAIGLFLGLLLQLAVLTARTAGEVISLEMGISMAAQVDPDSGGSSPLLARFYEESFLIAMFMVGGHHEVLRSLAESFERAPVGELHLDAGLASVATTMLGQMLSAGLAFAAPIMILLALVSVGLGLIARTVPQVNVLEMGFTLRIGVALVALAATTPLIEPTFEAFFRTFREGLGTGLDVLAGGSAGG